MRGGQSQGHLVEKRERWKIETMLEMRIVWIHRNSLRPISIS
jgi:hypothetical protein